MLPGIFAVEDDENGRFFPAAGGICAPAGLGEPRYEIVRRGIGRPARVLEPNHVRQGVIAEGDCDLPVVGPQSVRRIEAAGLIDLSAAISIERRTERSRED